MSRKKSKQRQSVPDKVRAEGSGPVQVVAEPSKKKFSKQKGPKAKPAAASDDDDAELVTKGADDALDAVAVNAVAESDSDDATAFLADADETKSRRRRKSSSDEVVEVSADDEDSTAADSHDVEAVVEATASVADADETKSKRRRKSSSDEVVEVSADDEDSTAAAAAPTASDAAEEVVEATASVTEMDAPKSKRRRKSSSDEVVEASAADDDSSSDTAGEVVAAPADVTKSKRRRKSSSDEVVEASADDDSSSDTVGEVVAALEDATKSKRRRKSSSDEAVEASADGDSTSDDLVSADAAALRRHESGSDEVVERKTDVGDVSADDVSDDVAVELSDDDQLVAAVDDDGEAEPLDADHADAEPLHADGDAIGHGEQWLAGSDDQLRAEGDGAGDDSPVIEGDDVVGAPITDEAGVEAALLPGTLSAVQLRHLIEALIFATDKPVTLQRLRQLTRVSDVARIEAALAELQEDYKDRGIALQQVSGGYQFRTNTAFSSWVQQLIAGRPVRLSRAQLETLAIVAYRQPITRPEIDEIRGVDSSNTLRLLLERSLIRVLGKREEVGRPTLYGTTKEFLDFFSLGDLRELPTLREYSELTAESRQVMSDRLGVPLDANGELVEPELTEDSDVETPELGNASIVESILAEHAAAEAEAEARYDLRDASAIAEAAMSGATSFGETSDSDDDAMALAGQMSSFGSKLPASEARSYVDAIRASVIDDEIDDVELSPDVTSETEDSMPMPESAEPSTVSTADVLISESHVADAPSLSPEPRMADGLAHSENPHVETPDISATAGQSDPKTDELVSIAAASNESTETAAERTTNDLNADDAMSTAGELMSESHEPYMADASIDVEIADSPSPRGDDHNAMPTADELMSESREPHEADSSDEAMLVADASIDSRDPQSEPHMADGLANPHVETLDTAADASIDSSRHVDAMSTAGEPMVESHEPHMADAAAVELESIERAAPHSANTAESALAVGDVSADSGRPTQRPPS